MFLTILDLILILALFLFIAFGFTLGLVQTIGALVGVVLGAWLAGMWYAPFSSWLEPFLLGHPAAAKIIAFILVFTIINRLVGLIFWIINKVFNLISIIPFTKSLNRILGAIFGLLEGTLVLGLILYFVSRFITSDWFMAAITSSKVAMLLVQIAGILTPLLPELLRQLKSAI
ncbi:MAG: CvpA family protein [Patescibacteria group bacterium]|jgi:membrane protein required for colicin V production